MFRREKRSKKDGHVSSTTQGKRMDLQKVLHAAQHRLDGTCKASKRHGNEQVGGGGTYLIHVPAHNIYTRAQ